MKRGAAVCVLCLLLAGCGGGESVLDRALEFRQTLLAGTGCTFSLDLTADYGDLLCRFSMDCQADDSGKVTFQVTQPQTLAGITGVLSGDTGALTFDGHLLAFDPLAEDLPTPVGSPWVLISTLREGYIRSAGQEDQRYRITMNHTYGENALQLDVWLDEKSNPVQCDILSDGRRILSMVIRDFRIL